MVFTRRRHSEEWTPSTHARVFRAADPFEGVAWQGLVADILLPSTGVEFARMSRIWIRLPASRAC